MGSEVVAIIPVREGSTRVLNKNFRKISNFESLLELKISQLKSQSYIEKIYVSSDSNKAREISESHGVEFLYREPFYCSSQARLHEYNTYMLSTIPGNPVVAWAMVTSPLFEGYDKAIKKYFNQINECDSLVTVIPYKDFLINKHGKPINCSFGHWHLLTQELDEAYQITGALYLAEKKLQMEWKYWIGLKPYLFETSVIESIDVDYEDDFKLAEVLLNAKSRGEL